MRYLKYLLIVVALVLLINFAINVKRSCFPNVLKLPGYLVLNSLHEIKIYNFMDGETKVIYETPYNINIGNLYIVNEHTLLFEEHPISKRIKIVLYDTKSKQKKILGEGTYILYIKKTNEVFYYKYDEIEKKRFLVKSPLDQFDQITKIIEEPKPLEIDPEYFPRYFVSRPIEISNNRIIFYGTDYNLWTYDYINHKLARTPITSNFHPYVFRSLTNELIGHNLDEYSLAAVLINLDTYKKITVKNLCARGAGAYIPDMDAMVFNRGVIEPYFFYSTKIYFFDKNKSIKILDDGYEHAAYTEENLII